MSKKWWWLVLLVCLGWVVSFEPGNTKKISIKVGCFPNITHAQALIGFGDCTFQKKLGKTVQIEKYIFNAGPSVIEAMMAGKLDLAYVGPNPAINGYIRTKGALLKIIAGAASGGAGLVVRSDLQIRTVKQLSGKRIASPQFGNTQDVALRFYLQNNGLKTVEKGGTVQVMPIANPDQLNLFQKKQLDAAWTVEPWVSRLITEAGGELLVDERSLWPQGKFVTANIIVSQKFLKKHPLVVKRWLEAHVELTRRINQDHQSAELKVNTEIKKLTGKCLPDEIIKQAFSRFEVTYDPLMASLFKSADSAYQLGYLKQKPNLKGIYDLKLLNEVLVEAKLPQIK